jgi:hypothetical protein
VRIVVTPEQRDRLAAGRSLKPDAYEAYLKGRYFLNQRTPVGEKNLELVLQARAHNNSVPAFSIAAAYARVGDKTNAVNWLGKSFENREGQNAGAHPVDGVVQQPARRRWLRGAARPDGPAALGGSRMPVRLYPLSSDRRSDSGSRKR